MRSVTWVVLAKQAQYFLFTNHLNVNSVCINHSLKSQVPDPENPNVQDRGFSDCRVWNLSLKRVCGSFGDQLNRVVVDQLKHLVADSAKILPATICLNPHPVH